MDQNTQIRAGIPEKTVDLDGETSRLQAVYADPALLQEAERYNIDLNSLEAAVEPQKAVREELVSETTAAFLPEHQFWQDLDVSLEDMVSQVLDTSERLVVIVTDDKIAYMNRAALDMLEVKSFREIIGENFLTFVDKSDWNNLAENIGGMISDGTKLKVKLRTASNKIHSAELKAIYLPDSRHFSFILLSSHERRDQKPVFNALYDDLTGLPNFYLFEDRVQMAVNNENYKDVRLPKDLIAVAAVSIDNMENFRKLHLENFVIKKLASNLLLSLKKNYTVARGLKYQFWILMPDLVNEHSLEVELDKLRVIFKEGVTDNFTTHEVFTSIGVSVFPDPARSGKKLIEQAIASVKKAQEMPSNSLVMFSGK